MAPPCLSRLLLVLLVGATNIVAHPMSKDSSAESDSVSIKRAPCTKMGSKETINKNHYQHIHDENPTIVHQYITVKADDEDKSKYKPDADGDEESTKTTYDNEASSKHDSNPPEITCKSSGNAFEQGRKWKEDADKHSKYDSSKDKKKKTWTWLDAKSKDQDESQDGFKTEGVTNLQKGRWEKAKLNPFKAFWKWKDWKSNDFKDKKHNKPVEFGKIQHIKEEQSKWDDMNPHYHDNNHKDELAPTGEKGLAKRGKILPRIVMWLPMVLKLKSRVKKLEKAVEELKKAPRQPSQFNATAGAQVQKEEVGNKTVLEDKKKEKSIKGNKDKDQTLKPLTRRLWPPHHFTENLKKMKAAKLKAAEESEADQILESLTKDFKADKVIVVMDKETPKNKYPKPVVW
ncbi:hypothetical protein F52700_12327 [Fusarium sp. NRRL 52700]|nr:hypothetical protein F52700_12327 [Fusarium sp. NRRL 52700]